MKKRLWPVPVLILLALILWIGWNDRALGISTYTVSSDAVPQSFRGFRIAQVSDLHNARFGKGNQRLLALLEQTDPDIIVLTGDLIDSRRTDVSAAVEFLSGAVQIAPCYYITGNHESRIPAELSALLEAAQALGVQILRNSSVTLWQQEEHIRLCGIDDPDFYPEDADYIADLQTLTDDDCFTVLLSHRPELFERYAACGAELVLSGHAHGGQFRLPLLGGLYAPHQGFLPRYDAGSFISGGTTMIVSRGIGNSLFPFRFNNPPEIVLVTLQ